MSGTLTAPRAVRKAPIEHPIRTKREFNEAVAEMDALLDLDPEEGTREYNRLDLLAVLVSVYEDENVPEPDLPTPQAAVRFMAEQKGVTASQLADLFGGRSRLSEFFTEKRELSRAQIKVLRDKLGIPADLLIAWS